MIIVGVIVLSLLILGGYGLIIRNNGVACGTLRNIAGPNGGCLPRCSASWPGRPWARRLRLAGGNQPAQVAKYDKPAVPMTFRDALAGSKKAGAAAAPMKIVSSVIGLLSQLFFVLFLRSVAVSFGDGFRAALPKPIYY